MIARCFDLCHCCFLYLISIISQQRCCVTFFFHMFRAIVHSLQCMLINLVSCVVLQFEIRYLMIRILDRILLVISHGA